MLAGADRHTITAERVFAGRDCEATVTTEIRVRPYLQRNAMWLCFDASTDLLSGPSRVTSRAIPAGCCLATRTAQADDVFGYQD